jgi:hypothetical protein
MKYTKIVVVDSNIKDENTTWEHIWVEPIESQVREWIGKKRFIFIKWTPEAIEMLDNTDLIYYLLLTMENKDYEPAPAKNRWVIGFKYPTTLEEAAPYTHEWWTNLKNIYNVSEEYLPENVSRNKEEVDRLCKKHDLQPLYDGVTIYFTKDKKEIVAILYEDSFNVNSFYTQLKKWKDETNISS